MRVTSSASARVSGGRIDGSRRASIVLPVPGGPTSSRLCAPAAAMTSASIAGAWPRTSARSGSRRRARGRAPGAAASGGRRRRAASPPSPGASHADDAQPSTSARLSRASRDDDQPGQPGALRSLGDGEGTATAPQLAAERELAEHRPVLERLGGHLPAGGQDGRGQREVEARADLAQVRRREVGRDAPQGELEARS